MSSLLQAIKRFGLADGIKCYSRLKKDPASISIGELREAVRLRPGTTDRMVFKQVFLQGEYDFTVPFQPRHILDAGGNIGLFALLMANRYPEARIVCVEPEPGNYQCLTANTAAYPGIVPVQAGIWGEDANLEVLTNGHDAWSFEVRQAAPGQPGTVPALSIGTLMASQGFPVIDILKMDVEGAESDVFARNTDHWLPRTRLLIIELHDDWLPGSSTSFWQAMQRHRFTHHQLGENLYFQNEDFAY